MITVRYIYSACVVIKTPDVTVLCDPWFTPAYEGAWVQWPPVDHPLKTCGPADIVYLSHVHPDHYDPMFLNQYLAQYPFAKVLIAQQDPALLERKLVSRGIKPLVGPLMRGGTLVAPVPNRANRGLNIDSALLVESGGQTVVNLNDNPYDQSQVDKLLDLCPKRRVTVALLPFVGAGPWPQCYLFDSPEDLAKAAQCKQDQFLRVFSRYVQALEPEVAVPFAGQYWLHGPQLDLNPVRGMADATQCRGMEYQPGCGQGIWVPADGGQSTLTIERYGGTSWDSERTQPYDWPTVREWLEHHDRDTQDLNCDPFLYRYEREIQVPVDRLPLLKLLQTVSEKVWRQFEYKPPVHLYIKTQQRGWFYVPSHHAHVTVVDHPTLAPRMEVTIDARYLFGVLTRLYNGNSARIGSLCRFKQVPAAYDEEWYDLFGDYWDSLRV